MWIWKTYFLKSEKVTLNAVQKSYKKIYTDDEGHTSQCNLLLGPFHILNKGNIIIP